MDNLQLSNLGIKFVITFVIKFIDYDPGLNPNLCPGASHVFCITEYVCQVQKNPTKKIFSMISPFTLSNPYEG